MNIVRSPKVAKTALAAATASVALVLACGTSSTGANSGADPDAGTTLPGNLSGPGTSPGSNNSPADASPGNAAILSGNPCQTAADCDPNAVCTDVGSASKVCRTKCATDTDCPGAEEKKSGCILIANSAPQGVCVPACVTYGTTCAGGFTCSSVLDQLSAPPQTAHVPFCKKIGATPLLGNCADEIASCGANAGCVYFFEPPLSEDVANSKCHTLCDAAHPCQDGKSECYIKPGDAFGFCTLG